MAESRREKRFLRLSIFCIGSAANAAITGPLAGGNAGLWLGSVMALGFRALPALGLGHCRPLGFGAMPAFGSGSMTTPWFRGDAGPWFQGIHPNCFEIQD